MLRLLHIENIAVIEQADILFERGFNVMTGETGAGKSIVIDAISAILGERAYRDMIRTGAARVVNEPPCAPFLTMCRSLRGLPRTVCPMTRRSSYSVRSIWTERISAA